MNNQIYTFSHSQSLLNKFLCKYNQENNTQISHEIIKQPIIPSKIKNNCLNQTETLKLLQANMILKPFYTFFFSAGTRFLYPFQYTDKKYSLEDTVARFSGRSIRIYHLIVKKTGKIKIFYGRIKFQILSNNDKIKLLSILEEDTCEIFLGHGLKYVTSVNGTIFPFHAINHVCDCMSDI